MKAIPLFVLLSFTSQVAAEQFLFLAATRDSELISYTINPNSGALTKHASTQLPGGGGPMSLTRDGEILYVESHIAVEADKRPKPHIVTLKIENGRFEQLYVAPVRLRSPSIYVDDSGRTLLGAHYGEGEVSVWEIDENRHCTGELTDSHVTAEKAHFITTDPSNRFAYVPHTGANAVFQFSLNSKARKLIPLDPPSVAGPEKGHQYHEPRHYAHHSKLDMGYTANERGGGISAWKFDRKTGKLTLVETLSTLPPGWEGNSYGADIKITPDGRFVYVSNRDGRKLPDGEKHGDTLAGFKIDPETGRLSPIGHFATEWFPRACHIDQTGNFIFAAGQRSNKLATYRINQKTGALEPLKVYETGEQPIWMETVLSKP